MDDADIIKKKLAMESPNLWTEFSERDPSTALDSLKVNVWEEHTMSNTTTGAKDPWGIETKSDQKATTTRAFTPQQSNQLDFGFFDTNVSPASALYTSAAEMLSQDSSKASEFDLFSTPTATTRNQSSSESLLVDFGTPIPASPALAGNAVENYNSAGSQKQTSSDEDKSLSPDNLLI